MLSLKLLSLGLQVLILGILVRQYRWPFGFARWRLAWGALILGGLCMVGRRVYDLWLPVNLWSILLPIGVSCSMAVGFWQLSIILQRKVELTQPTDAAWVEIDSFSVIVAWDRQAEQLLGWSPVEAIGQTLMQTIIPPRDWEAHRDGMSKLLATGDEGRVIARTFAVNACRKNGAEIPVTIRVTSVPHADGTLHFLGQIRELGVL